MSNALERFEAIADLYYRRFHRLAPGKDEGAASYRDSNDDENRAQFSLWLSGRQLVDDAIDRIIALNEKVEELERRIEELEEGAQ